MNPLTSAPARLGVALLVQLALIGAAVAPQLSARFSGEEYLLRVAPIDPIDPFRGAYVDLGYPDLPLDQLDGSDDRVVDDDEKGTLYVALVEEAGVWVSSGTTRERPAGGPYLTCDDSDWRLRCGIESLFLPQDEALALEQSLASGEAVARVRIDGHGNAALIAVEAAG